MGTKLDLRQEHKALYSASTKAPSLVDVPPLQYLAVEGIGDPNSAPAYHQAMEALYGMAYTIKFAVKRGPLAVDYPVMPLEGLWWADDMGSFLTGDRANWRWISMILQPSLVSEAMVDAARVSLATKRDPAALQLVRLEQYREGLCAQIMHLGPYAAEGPTIERLHRYIENEGLRLAGKHHEIYLGDPRRTAPERLRTIIRQQVSR